LACRRSRGGEECRDTREKGRIMKLCRYDDDRLGVVRGDLVHDVTLAQTEIRNSLPYAMKGDAVVAALPQWRERIERMADQAPRKPIGEVRLLAPVARPTKLSCAPTNYQAHIAEMKAAAAQPGSQVVTVQSAKIGEAGMFLKANSSLVGPSERIAVRFPDRRSDHEVELVIVVGRPAATFRNPARLTMSPATASVSTSRCAAARTEAFVNPSTVMPWPAPGW
jgi:2-keto-4-pentenoate hydratase/2-oxohepta-3-ene-1,7-dioic acid hydratase in catechol pathway